MYAVTTHELGRVTGTSWLTSVGRWEVRVAAAFWVVVFGAMAVTGLRPRRPAAPGPPHLHRERPHVPPAVQAPSPGATASASPDPLADSSPSTCGRACSRTCRGCQP
ncbi:hypothetical protein [Streptomyces humi]